MSHVTMMFNYVDDLIIYQLAQKQIIYLISDSNDEKGINHKNPVHMRTVFNVSDEGIPLLNIFLIWPISIPS